MEHKSTITQSKQSKDQPLYSLIPIPKINDEHIGLRPPKRLTNGINLEKSRCFNAKNLPPRRCGLSRILTALLSVLTSFSALPSESVFLSSFSQNLPPSSRFFCSRPPLLKPPQLFFFTSPNLFLSKTLFLPFFFLSSQTPPFISFIENHSFLSRKMAPASFRCRLLERPPSQFSFLLF